MIENEKSSTLNGQMQLFFIKFNKCLENIENNVFVVIQVTRKGNLY